MIIGKKTPPMKTFHVRYIIKTEHDEFSREISLRARSKEHAKRNFFAIMGDEKPLDADVLLVDLR